MKRWLTGQRRGGDRKGAARARARGPAGAPPLRGRDGQVRHTARGDRARKVAVHRVIRRRALPWDRRPVQVTRRPNARALNTRDAGVRVGKPSRQLRRDTRRCAPRRLPVAHHSADRRATVAASSPSSAPWTQSPSSRAVSDTRTLGTSLFRCEARHLRPADAVGLQHPDLVSPMRLSVPAATSCPAGEITPGRRVRSAIGRQHHARPEPGAVHAVTSCISVHPADAIAL